MATNEVSGAEVGYLEVAMASSFAVAGPTLLYALWTGDLRYLPHAGWITLATAWATGVILCVLPIVTGYRLWKRAGH